MGLALLAALAGAAYLPWVGAAFAPRWDALFVLAPLLCLLRVRSRGRPWAPTAGHRLGAASLAVFAASALWSEFPLDTLGVAAQAGALGMVFMLSAEQDDLSPVFLASGWACALSALVMVAQLALGHPPSGLFGNKDFAAEYGTAVLAGLWAGDARTGSRVGYAVLAGAAVCAFLPLARGPLVAFAAASWLWLCDGHLERKSKLAGLAAVAAALGVYLWLHGLDVSMVSRLSAWATGILDASWFGHGLGTYGSLYPWSHAFNDLVEMVSDLGVLASVPATFVAWCLWRKQDDDTGRDPCFFVLVALLVEGAFDTPLRFPATAFLAAVALGGLSRGVERVGTPRLLGRDHGRACAAYREAAARTL